MNWKSKKMTSVWLGKKYIEKVPVVSDHFFGALHIKTDRIHPNHLKDPNNCVSVGTGPWHEKIYHFLPGKTPSSGGNEIQSEYFVDKN